MTNAVTLASLANSGYLRNRIINGNMAIDQRNNGASVSTGGTIIYTLDRWYVGSNGAATTIQRVTGATTNQYRLQVTGAAGVTNATVSQRIEASNCADMAGKTVTLSFDAADSLLTSLTWSVSYANTTNSFGTLTSPTVTAITSGSITISSTVTRYSVTFDVPVAANTGLVVQFTVGAQTSGTFTLGNVQLELGTVQTPFEWRPYGTELQLAQRYYAKMINTSIFGDFGNAANYSVVNVFTPVPMRATPTLTVTSVSGTFGAQLGFTNYNWCGYYIVAGAGSAASVFEPAFNAEL